jgi:hypothetical protein|tara:strand:+ start:302 stop:460 length:159 start_codon:yes stop_codon:yes gene_type:complete
MDINERVQEILDKLEESINYEDFRLVDEARKELLFVLEELESDYPTHDTMEY